jgi:predicted O-methyltransferase YrrM
MARVAKVVGSIDPFDRCHVVNGRDTFPTYRENIYCHNVASKIVPCVGPSTFVCPLLRRDSFDVAFIDGEHTYEAVRDDIACVEPLVVKGGVIAFHDYGEDRFAGVKQAIDEWRKDRRFEVVDSLALVWL